MISESGIDKLVELTSPAEINKMLGAMTGQRALAIPTTVKVHDFERYFPKLLRMKQQFQTQDLESFAVYSIDMAGQYARASETTDAAGLDEGLAAQLTPLFVDESAMSARVVFDFASVEDPLHCDNTATLTLRKTAEYRQFLEANDNPMRQKNFAEWLEDWRAYLVVYDQDGGTLPMATAISAVRKYEVLEKNEVGSEEKSFSQRKSATSEVGAKNAEKLPGFVGFKCKPYKELNQREFMTRVSISDPQSPVFRLRAIQLETVAEDIASEFCRLIGDRINEDGVNCDRFAIYKGSI